MDRYHADALEEFEAKFDAKTDTKTKRKNDFGIDSYFAKKPRGGPNAAKASRVNQREFNDLVSQWVGVSLRPFSISEDPGIYA